MFLSGFTSLLDFFREQLPRKPYGQTEVRLVSDFLTDGIISKSVPHSVFMLEKSEKKFTDVMKRVIDVLHKVASDDSDPIISTMSAEVIGQLQPMCKELSTILPELKCGSFESILYNITSQNSPEEGRSPHGLCVLKKQLAICQQLERFQAGCDPKRANAYLFSLAMVGNAAKSVYKRPDLEIPVISKCTIQSLGDPNFDPYEFFTNGVVALFYNNVDMLDEIEFCLRKTYSTDCRIRFELLRHAYRHDNDSWSDTYRRVMTVLKINSIPISPKNPLQRTSDALFAKLGPTAVIPMVAHTRNF
jgi:hypothetical protein